MPEPQTPTTVQDNIAAARARLAEGGSVVPAEEPSDAEQERETAPTDGSGGEGPGSEAQAQDSPEGGPGVREGGSDEAAEEEDGAREAEAPPQAEARGEGEEEVVAEPSEEIEEEEPSETFLLTLPVRREGDDPIELELDGLDEQTIDRLRQFQAEGLRRKELTEAMGVVREAEQRLHERVTEIEADPVNYMLGKIPSRQVQVDMARHLLSIPEVYEAVLPELVEWDGDENVRKAAMATMERDRLVQAQRTAQHVAQLKRHQDNAALVAHTLEAMIPESMNDSEADRFFRLAVEDIKAYVAQHRVEYLDTSQVPLILTQTQLIGPSSKALFPSISGEVRTAEPSPAVPPQGATDTSLPAEQPTGESFRHIVRKKKAAAATPPGIGPAPASITVPDEIVSIRDRIAYYKKQM